MIAVGRVRDIPTGVAYPSGQDTWLFADQILHAPEAAASEYCPVLIVTHE
jgi:hypothetical protein